MPSQVSAADASRRLNDLLHIGELGDAVDSIVARLDRSLRRPERQERYTCRDQVPLDSFPAPNYSLLELRHYMMGTVQFSSGCPYRCEFCDIPELYGRNPRLKTPEHVLAELDAMLAHGNPGIVFFVDELLDVVVDLRFFHCGVPG